MDILLKIINNTNDDDNLTYLFVDRGYYRSIPPLLHISNPKITVNVLPSEFINTATTISNIVNHNVKEVIYMLSEPIYKSFVSQIISYHLAFFEEYDRRKSSNNGIQTTPVTIFTSVMQDFYVMNENTVKSPYQMIKEWFLPLQIAQIYHLPYHVTRLHDDSRLSIFQLSSVKCSRLFPIIKSSRMDEEEEVSKADSGIQSPTRGEKAKSMERIKFFAHELTSALIFNYGKCSRRF